MKPAIEVQNLSKEFRLGAQANGYRTVRESITGGLRRMWRAARRKPDAASGKPFWALKDVSFAIEPGGVVGIIGRNGSGKSTLLKILSRIYEPTTGRAVVRGRVASLLEVGTGFHPELTGRENIYLNGSLLGMQKHEIRRKFDDIVAFSEVEQFLDTPVKRYSSGMYVRLAFSVAAHLEPEILIVDEVLAVGDQQFQAKCIRRMEGVAKEGRTVVVVSHNLSVVKSLCSSAMVLHAGQMLSYGETNEQVRLHLERVTSGSSTSLIERTDREGDGRAKTTGMTILDGYGNVSNTLLTGDPWSIDVDYTAEAQERLKVSLSVWTLDGTKVFHVDNRLRGTDLGQTRGQGRVRCEFPKMNLSPGQYYCNVMLTLGDRMADHVYRAIDFQVHEGDYYRVGQCASGVGGIMMMDHNWMTANGPV